MITEKDLREAIAECQGTRNPNASTCMKLASFYTILDHMQEPPPVYSYSAPPESTTEKIVEYSSGTEFSGVVNGMSMDRLLPVLDEAMTAIQVLNPRLYASILRKLEEG